MNPHIKAAIATVGSIWLLLAFVYGCYLTHGWLFAGVISSVLLATIYFSFLSEFGD